MRVSPNGNDQHRHRSVLQTYTRRFTSSSSSLVFSPKAGFGRNQSPVRRPVWLWHTAFQAVYQGQVAIAFPRLQTFPLSPLGASTFKRHERPLSAKYGREMAGQFCDMGDGFTSPPQGRHAVIFFGIEPAILGTRGQHANHQTTEAAKCFSAYVGTVTRKLLALNSHVTRYVFARAKNNTSVVKYNGNNTVKTRQENVLTRRYKKETHISY